MIPSGSHVPGIDPDSFGLPAGTAIRYERPAEALKPFFSAYAILDSDPEIWDGAVTWMLPSCALIWIVLTDGAIGLSIRNRHYAQLGRAGVFGPTSRAMPVTANGGVSIVLQISPVGWARWFDAPADTLRDRITPLNDLWPEDWVAALIEALYDSDRGEGVKAILDDFLAARLPPPVPHEARIAQAEKLLADPALGGSQPVAGALGISTQALLRLANRTFGFGPKLVMRRTRFLRALAEMILADGPPDFSAIPIGYHDVPHFLRDAQDFLGMTPRRFLEVPTPYLHAAMRARRLVIGAAWPPLDPLRPPEFL